MLTKTDLQQIRDVVRTEVREEVRAVVHTEVREIVRTVVRTEVRGVVREEVKAEISVQLKPVNRKLNTIQKDMKLMMEDYTNAIKHVRERVNRIEDHLGYS